MVRLTELAPGNAAGRWRRSQTEEAGAQDEMGQHWLGTVRPTVDAGAK